MNQSRWTDLVWVDILGRPRVVRVPGGSPGEHVIKIPKRQVLAGYDNGGREGGFLRFVPDLDSERVVAWDPDRTIVMGDLHEEDGSPSPLCTRSALRRITKTAREQAYEVFAAAELEFFVLAPETQRPIYSDIQQYSIIKGTELEPLLHGVRNDLRRMDIPIEASNPEYSGGQVEVNIEYGPALQAADRATLMRALVRVLASRADLGVTFMAKPWTHEAGCGLHLHQSLWRDGHNAFAADDGGLSDAALHYAAGLLARIRDFALLGSPTPNAYHRRNDYTFAPTRVCWGSDNRTLAVRAVTSSQASTRLEQRDASADCNVYLALAGQIAAGLAGLRDGVDPPPTVSGDAYARTDLPSLPRSFLEAFELFSASAEARAIFGESTVASYLEVLDRERDVLLRTATDWERDRYLASV